MKEGDKITIRDLLYSSLVGSTNNTVETLVRVSGLKRAEFINRMNKTVKKWGTKNTNFVEPTGLSSKNVSSSLDYAIITKEAFKDGNLAKLASTAVYTVKINNVKKTIKNTNSLVGSKTYDVIGSKTGFTNEAGNCLMTRVELKNKKNIIAVVLGNELKKDSTADVEKLIEYASWKLQ